MKKLIFFIFLASLLISGCATPPLANTPSEGSERVDFDDKLDSTQVTTEKDTIDTSSWETYTSKQYNFTIKYPREFQVNEGVVLKGTGSEHYSIDFSKGFEHGFMVIAPDSAYGSRGVENPKSYEQIIDGKKALIEEWHGGSAVNLKFLDPIDKWKMCDMSEFCEHISFLGAQKLDREIFKKMISTIKFIPN